MFGKGKRKMSSNEKFIIRAGVDAGNLKGRGTADKTAPMAKGSPMVIKEMFDRPISKGKAGPVKITGGG